ncbi:MAG TPA: hypothetical protein VK789_20040, partial [Bryobacteraceae bacterium]|nr:hypothetical protein [Bryobacteraceae bacterium]
VRRVGLDLIVHTPDAAPVADLWRQLCHRPFCPPPAGTRFYQMAGARACELASDSFANSYTEQFLNTIDFPRLIESAWRDGVRVFVEHGPLGTCSKWIPQILGERSHAAVPLAAVGSDALAQSAAAIAQMFVAGVAIDPERFNGRMRQTRASVRTLRLPAHLPRLTGLRRALPPSDAARPSPAAIPGRSFAVYRTRAASLTGNSNGSLERPGSGVQPSHSHASVGARLAPSVALLERDAAPAPPVKLTRAQLELTTFGKPSEVFGPMFRPLDDYPRIVRLPMAQMLLADRITSIEGERGSMGTGAIVAETDIVSGAWYLNSGRMPPSIVAEAGQVQMLLISWLGIDFLVKGERKYRALGCDMTIHSEMPTIGDTLRCEARITGHAKQGDLRLFFFEYDCYAAGRLFASARNGQAGFFTESELSSSTGIVWNPEGARWSDFRPGTEQPQRELPSSYPLEKVRAAAAGNAYECFGEGFEVAAAQQRAPSFCNEKFLMIDSVAVLDIHGGPKGRGYLRASYNIKPDHWVFGCHFKDDPCLPGTFMFEGAMQCMSFYLMALGCTLRRDGWRFEPVPGSPYPVRFRGQITPQSKVLTYELFVDEIVNGDEPTLYAHVLGLVDGVKTFHFPRLAVRLVPGHPLDLQPPLEAEKTEVASVNGVRLDRQTMMECALGLPSKAFGAPYARFDRYERCPRVPAPPLKFIDLIRRLDGTFGVERAGAVVEAEYDLIPDAWYFEGARKRTMAFAALLEAALQPCGWLGFFTGVALRSKTEVYFRNLDGNAIVHAACPEREGKLRTRAVLTSLSRSGPITLLGFDVRTMLDDVLLLEVQTKFGFFRAEELRGQKGIPASPDEIARFGADSAYHAAIAPDGPVPLPSGKLLMIDRITGLWAGGAHGCGRIRGEKSISPSDWFFRSHFYGDPVQPGSLGIEAILQTARYYAMEGYARDRGFSSIASSPSGIIEWKYRGQVLPANRKIETEVSILGIRNDGGGCEMECHASLWSDGIRIYSVPRFALRLQREI